MVRPRRVIASLRHARQTRTDTLGKIWLREGELPPDVLPRVVRASGNVIEPIPLGARDEDDTPLL